MQVMSGNAVGATDLLNGAAGECFQTDMGQPTEQLADAVGLEPCPVPDSAVCMSSTVCTDWPSGTQPLRMTWSGHSS